MSKRDNLAREFDQLLNMFAGDRFMLIQALLQVTDREKILAMNRLRVKYGEPEIVPEPLMYQKGSEKIEWVIDVPQEWVGLPL